VAVHCWLVKQEPSDYPWSQLVSDGRTAWTGVRNYAARLHLRAMQVGDRVLYYHSGEGREVVGVARVARAAYPDPTAREGEWVAVDLEPIKPLKQPVSLATIKADPALGNLPLIRQSRLSVMPVGEAEFARLLALGGLDPTHRGTASATGARPATERAAARSRASQSGSPRPRSFVCPDSFARPGTSDRCVAVGPARSAASQPVPPKGGLRGKGLLGTPKGRHPAKEWGQRNAPVTDSASVAAGAVNPSGMTRPGRCLALPGFWPPGAPVRTTPSRP